MLGPPKWADQWSAINGDQWSPLIDDHWSAHFGGAPALDGLDGGGGECGGAGAKPQNLYHMTPPPEVESGRKKGQTNGRQLMATTGHL